MDSKIPVDISHNRNMNKYHQTLSVNPGKMTDHLESHYIMEKSQPQMIEEYKEQVR